MAFTKRRREERVAISLPIRLWGMDANGKPFTQTATTLDITRTGARIGGLARLLKQGDVVGMQHGAEKARFRVAWVGRAGGSEQGQAGLHCIQPGKSIWEESLKEAARRNRDRRDAEDQQDTQAYVGFEAPSSRHDGDERRGEHRYRCTGKAQVVNQQTNFTTWGSITDLSASGCYVETALPIASGEKVSAVLTFLGRTIRCNAEVRASHPAVGMGLLFLDVNEQNRDSLKQMLERLVARTEKNAPRPTTQTETAAPQIPPSSQSGVSAGIYKVSAELRELEARLAGGSNLDPKVLGEFRRTMDSARQTAWSVQQLLESGDSVRATAGLLSEFEARRIRSATELVHELVLDIDSNAIHLGTEGLAGLVAAVAQLHQRLTSLTDSPGRTSRGW
jgi:PilZ domain